MLTDSSFGEFLEVLTVYFSPETGTGFWADMLKTMRKPTYVKEVCERNSTLVEAGRAMMQSFTMVGQFPQLSYETPKAIYGSNLACSTERIVPVMV